MNESNDREKEIFSEALEQPSTEAREAYLLSACGEDSALRRQIDALLKVHQSAEGFLPHKDSSETELEPAPLSEGSGSVIGHYKLLEKLGEGGFGAVWAADQKEPVRRRVALKIIKLGMDTQQVVARFGAERQALALMDHPNIAKVLDAGATDTGRPYFVMELVKGVPLTQYCDQEKFDPKDRIDLFIKVCHAIQHAHQKGIIHRDIKPSNIMVTLHDGVPVPKVIDFGIAKATQQDLTEQTIYTQYSQFIGTPAYMSPEQAEMSGLDIDTRSDIYSLGVLLYELLTGSTPFDSHELMQSGLDEMRKIIREKEPIRPSTRLSQTLALSDPTSRSGPLNSHSKIESDMDWIVMKCLEKDRSRRYDTANGLALDLNRFLTNEPVLARPPSAIYRFQKAWRRNKVAFSAGIGVATALIAGISISVFQAKEATKARNEAQSNLSKANAAELKAAKERDLAILAKESLRERVYVSDIGLAHKALEEGNLGRAQGLLAKHQPSPSEQDLRGFEWRYLWSQSQGEYAADLGEYTTGFLGGVAVSPDGQFVALNRKHSNRLEVIHLPSGKLARGMEMRNVVSPLSFSATGNLLIGQHLSQLISWDTRTWEQHEPLPLRSPFALGQQAQDEILVALEQDHFSVWNLTTWKKIGYLENNSPESPLLAPVFGGPNFMRSALTVSSKNQVAYLAGKGGIRRWDLSQLKELSPFNIDGIICVAASPDGVLAAADIDNKVHLIDQETGRVLQSAHAHVGWITSLKYSSDGSRLVSASADRKLVVYDPNNLSHSKPLLGHLTEVWGLDISADGTTIVSGAGYGGSVLKWSLPRETLKKPDLVEVIGYNIQNDGRILVYDESAPDLNYYDPVLKSLEPAQTKRLIQAMKEAESKFLCFSPNAKWVASTEGIDLVVRNVVTGAKEKTIDFRTFGWVNIASFSANNEFLVTKANLPNSKIRIWTIWKTADWTPEILCESEGGSMAFGVSGDSSRLAISDHRKTIRIFDLELKPHELLQEMEIGELSIYSVALSPKGRWLAAGASNNTINIWDLKTQKRIRILHGHVMGVWSLSFSQDGRTLASSTGNSRFKLWHVGTWQELMTIKSEGDGIQVQFSPNGRHLVSASQLGQNRSRIGLQILNAPTLIEIENTGKTKELEKINRFD